MFILSDDGFDPVWDKHRKIVGVQSGNSSLTYHIVKIVNELIIW